MDNLEGIDEFLDTYNLARLNYEKTETPNRLIMIKEIKSVMNSFPSKKKKKKAQDLMASWLNFIRHKRN